MARRERQKGRPRILVIDGNSVFRASLAGFLQRHQFEVEEGSSGDEGLKVLETFRPNLCVIDLLPAGRMTGVEIAEAMHAKDPSIRYVFLSAFLEPAWDERAAFLQDAPLVRKPVNLEELTAVVARALSPKAPLPPRCDPASPQGGRGHSLPRAITDRHLTRDRNPQSLARNSVSAPLPRSKTTHHRFRH